ncbi:hypothetical protein BTO06_02560 [Tenacibaculum sp. SZ-18]|uniref:M56 family metallopeptidase n=1 Tax=Tenacibaculum sp. SZ-18 TaxID=754423 RepID=UPI000C2D5525|nr:M56 family metallopeptidase [Tenacibaculum sp. SZ-18]AUC14109.1 hypothetical protein BTO06_02560 [Tenacibaculum sp. SZ-18]
MLSYTIQVILFQILFLAVYDIFLSRETFFTTNRIYLIFSVIISFILPLIKLPVIKDAVPQEYTILLPEVVLSPQTIIEKQEWYQSVSYLNVLFWIGAFAASLCFLIKLYSVIKLLWENNVEKRKDYKLINLSNSTKAFSFFNFIFIGENIPSKRKEKIIQHELVHAKQKHTIDLLFFEVLKICMWFNPILWVFQKRITTVHEFLSDEIASKSLETKTYINSLLEQVFQVEKISFVNQFYKSSLIKKRIIMMTKKRSTKVKQFKYLLIAPVLLSMLMYTSCLNEEQLITETERNIFQSKISFHGEDYFLKSTTKDGQLKAYNEAGEEVNPNTVFPDHKFYYDKEGFLVCEFELGKIYSERNSFKTKDFYAFVFKRKVKNVPFYQLDKFPSFQNEKASKDTFNRNMVSFVNQNIDLKFVNSLDLNPGKTRVFAQFKIDENGNVIDINVRAPHPKLVEYIKSVIQKLPRLIPGEKDGEVVKVGYTLPIAFNIK